MEYCWNITPRCNANCRFCHRFLGIEELDDEADKKVLERMIKQGVDNITFTGGEPLLRPDLVDLIAIAHKAGVKTKIVTNGLLMSPSRMSRLAPNLDQLTMSLDSLKAGKNRMIGRGVLQAECVLDALSEAKKYPKMKVAINTMLSRKTAMDIDEIGAMLDKYKRDGGNLVEWRIFQFVPMRERAKRNAEMFVISDEKYNAKIKDLREKYADLHIVTRRQHELESEYTLILANGDACKTINGVDVKIGNLLDDTRAVER